MGKNIQNQDNISLEYVNRGGCMHGFLQHINHPKWNYVKKRLPYRKHKIAPRLPPVSGDPENDSTTNASSVVEAKVDVPTATTASATATANSEILSKSPAESSSVHKSSMKSRIKALITEEVSKRRGKHRRCCSYPARLPLERSPSINLSVKKVSNVDEPSAVSNLLDPLGKHSVKDDTLVQESLACAVDQSKDSSQEDSKVFTDALDLVNRRKEFFLKVLQDPTSSLSHQLRCHKASVNRSRFQKSLSFPASGSSGRNHRSFTGENEWMMRVTAPKSIVFASTGEKNVLSRMPSQQMLVDTSLGSTLEPKQRQSNTLVMKRFKKLREKVKQAIKENKTERYRIIMDSIMHKVPYGRGSAKDNKQDVVMHPGSAAAKKYLKCRSANNLNSNYICPEEKQMRRTSSFNESLERYNQSSFIESLERYNRLLEMCLGKEAQQAPDSSRQRMCTEATSVGSSSVSLKRIRSLPDLSSYSLSRLEESPCTIDFPQELFSKAVLNVGLDTHVNLEFSYKHVPEESAEVGGTNDNIRGLKKPDYSFSKLEVDALETCSRILTADEDLEPMLEDSSQYDEDFASLTHELRTYSPTSPENNISINQGATQAHQTTDKRLRIQVDTSIENEFNYVRDVLELSGINGDVFFKNWDATTKQPLDQSVFEEMEECLLVQNPNSSGSWNHILVFDVINEVILEMSQRTFSNWPAPLTYACHAYRIPVGCHVLEEVWKNISWHLSGQSEVELTSLDSSVSRNLSKDDGWMNLQFEVESVGLEMEEWILDDLLDELFLGWPSFG